MGLYMVGEWMEFHLWCVKPRVGETSEGTAETPGSWGILVTDQCVTEPDPVLFLEECCRDVLHTSKAEVTHRQDKYLKKSRWYHGGLFQQYETAVLNFVICFSLNTLSLKPVNDFFNANFLIVLTG